MKRFGWLVLLISLGVNLGLGYRILNPTEAPERGQRGGFQGEGHRASQRDTSSWRQIMDGRLQRIASRLELTPEQLTVFQVTHRENSAGFLAQRRKVNLAQDNLRFLIAGGSVAPDSVRLAIQAVGREQAVLDSLITESILSEMEVLDQDQKSRYLQILPVFKDRASGPRKGRGGRFQGR